MSNESRQREVAGVQREMPKILPSLSSWSGTLHNARIGNAQCIRTGKTNKMPGAARRLFNGNVSGRVER